MVRKVLVTYDGERERGRERERERGERLMKEKGKRWR
jgi:hypothetical protein